MAFWLLCVGAIAPRLDQYISKAAVAGKTPVLRIMCLSYMKHNS